MSDVNGGDTFEVDGYDDFDGATEADGLGSVDSGNRTVDDDTMDEQTAVLKILSGEDLTPEEEAAAKSRKGRDTTSRNLDGYGNTDWDAGRAGESSSSASKSPYGFDIDSPTGSQITQQRDAAQAQWERAHQAKAQIEQALRDGDISEQEAQQALHMAGMYAGQARGAMLENELAARNLKDYHNQAYAHIAQAFDINPNDKEAVNKAMSGAVTFLRENGVSDESIVSVEDPAVAIVAIKAQRAIENDAKQRSQIIQQKKQIRSLKKRLGIADNKATKSAQMGQRHGQEHQIDQVAALLSEIGMGGRR